MAKEATKKRRPIRFLIKLAIFAGLIFSAGRMVMQKKNEFSDLTESEARSRLIDKVSRRVGDETAKEIADQVIPKLKDRGLIKPDPTEAAAGEVEQAGTDGGSGVAGASQEKADKVEGAADKD